MAGIVRTWGQFVDDDLVVFGDEQFDGQNAGEFEASGQSQRQLVRLLGHGFVHFGRRDGHVQDVVAMLVAHDREGHVILAVAGDEDARFEREIDEASRMLGGKLRHGRRGRAPAPSRLRT